MIAHSNDSSHLDEGDDRIMISVPVPLPTEIPPPPNLSQLPAHILHSGTVETLIGQNEDLMVRLKVNIRRNGVLEQRILQQEAILEEIQQINASLVAQVQILQEKERILRDRSSGFDVRAEEMRDEIMLLKTKLEAAEERRDELHAGLEFESSFRRRVRKWVRPYINELRGQSEFLDQQLNSREAALADLRSRFQETIVQLQGLHRKHTEEKTQLVEQFEARQAATEAELAKATTELKHLREKATRLDETMSAKSATDNQNVYLERKIKEMEASLGGELKTFQEQASSFRKEAKALAAELATAFQDLNKTIKERDEARTENARIQDQFESLQCVWTETQKKMEASRLQQDALNKLNQELSRQLKDKRKAADANTNESSAATSMSNSSSASSPTPPPLTSMAPAKSGTSTTNQKIERIETLLAEIESGFPLGRLDIIEDQARKGTNAEI
ncbi:MAG: hypothetical protein V4760_19250 [Bdellovibrionota bacterium]